MHSLNLPFYNTTSNYSTLLAWGMKLLLICNNFTFTPIFWCASGRSKPAYYVCIVKIGSCPENRMKHGNCQILDIKHLILSFQTQDENGVRNGLKMQIINLYWFSLTQRHSLSVQSQNSNIHSQNEFMTVFRIFVQTLASW